MKNNIFKFSFLVLIIFMMLPVYVYAKVDFNGGDEHNVISDVDGTGAYAGNKLKVSSKIAGILFAGGSEVEVTGSNDYAFIGGANINLNMSTQNDIFVLGNTITIGQENVIGRDSYIGGNELYLSGKFTRDVRIEANTVVIESAIINGNIKISANQITIADNVQVLGKLEINDNATVDINTSASLAKVEYYHVNIVTQSALDIIKVKVFSFMGLIILFITMNFMFPKLFTSAFARVKNAKFNDYVSLSGIGFISMIIMPITALIAIFSGIGFSVGLIISLLFIITITISKIIIGYIIGQLVKDKYYPNLHNELLINILGMAFLFVLTILPIIGGTVTFAVFLISLGLLTKLLVESRKVI